MHNPLRIITPLAIVAIASLLPTPRSIAEDKPSSSAAEAEMKNYQEFKEFQEYKKNKARVKKPAPKPDGRTGDDIPTPSQPRPQPHYQLSADEADVLNRGEIGATAYLAGGVVGTVTGFGIGHAIQGRYAEKGWIFTIGEAASAGLFSYGAVDCMTEAAVGSLTQTRRTCNDTAMGLGLAGILGFRLWEVIDLWASPPSHNDRYRRIKVRVDREQGVSFYLTPTLKSELVAGLQIRL